MRGAGQAGVFAEEGAESDGCFFVLGNPNPGDDAAGADHTYRLVIGGHVAYGFEYHVRAVAAGDVHDLGDAGFAAFSYHVGGPEFAARSVRSLCRPMRMMRSAPRDLAASTADRPTAPSPMTVTILPGVTSPMWAAW